MLEDNLDSVIETHLNQDVHWHAGITRTSVGTIDLLHQEQLQAEWKVSSAQLAVRQPSFALFAEMYFADMSTQFYQRGPFFLS